MVRLLEYDRSFTRSGALAKRMRRVCDTEALWPSDTALEELQLLYTILAPATKKSFLIP